MSPKVVIKIPKYNIPVRKVEPVFIEINRLLPHEEIVSKRLEDLMSYIKEINAVDMPIIVAPIPGTDKYLIVDGHHRWAALKELGASKAPAIIIDYFDPSVKLYTWYPSFTGGYKEFARKLKKAGLEYREIDCRSYQEYINMKNIAFVVVSRKGPCLVIYGGIEGQKKVSKILDELASNGDIRLIYYGVEEDALKDLDKGEVDYVLLRRIPSKKEVMETVKKGEVFSPKTTRHVLPYIPAKTYTPLAECF